MIEDYSIEFNSANDTTNYRNEKLKKNLLTKLAEIEHFISRAKIP